MEKTLALILIGMAVTASAGEEVDLAEAAAPDGLVKIVNVRGDIRIEGWDREEITVKGELDDLAEELIFTVNGRKALIEVKMPRRNVNWGDGSDLEIRLPFHSRVDFEGVSSEVSVIDVQGGLRVKSVSGDIDADQIGDRMLISSVSGRIKLEECKGTLRASTVSGDLSVDAHTGAVDLESVSGEIDLKTAANDKLHVRSVSGEIEIEARLEQGTGVDINSVSGDVDLEIVGDVNAHFDLDAGMGGEISNELSDATVETSFMGRERLTTSIGDGDSRVMIRTVSADIKIE